MPDNTSIAMLTNKTYLMKKNSSSKWEEFIPITKYPQIGGEPEKIEVTRLKDTKKRYILGLQDSDSLSFEANYLKEDYKKLNAVEVTETVNTYRLCFGDTKGTDGCFEWSGKVVPYITEGESNAARKMSFTISDEGDLPVHEVEPLTDEELATA